MENERRIFSLLEVTKSIQKTLQERYGSAFWVKAEMNKLNFYNQSGHCYPELVEKQNGKVIAQMKACLWKDDFIRSNRRFQAVLKEPLKDGIKILFLGRVTFDPAHGLSLTILDIDPSYTLGDLEREKLETIQRLRDEGLYDRNKAIALPLLPQRIAIISVESSKGFADFTKVIETNPWGYKVFMQLFPAVLQGDRAVDSIIYQLERVLRVKEHFDVVAIIRGGGGDIGLSCYNHYRLASTIARFPIPVITGIGHATNETVSEMVSFYNAITPTKLADFIMQRFHDFSVPVQEASRRIAELSRRLISDQRARFQGEIRYFRSVCDNVLDTHQESCASAFEFLRRAAMAFCSQNGKELSRLAVAVGKDVGNEISTRQLELGHIGARMRLSVSQFIKSGFERVGGLEKNVAILDPQHVLKRGYSITLVNGKVVRGLSQVDVGDTVETVVMGGTIQSKVQAIKVDTNE